MTPTTSESHSPNPPFNVCSVQQIMTLLITKDCLPFCGWGFGGICEVPLYGNGIGVLQMPCWMCNDLTFTMLVRRVVARSQMALSWLSEPSLQPTGPQGVIFVQFQFLNSWLIFIVEIVGLLYDMFWPGTAVFFNVPHREIHFYM